jgi:hypothetical protein
LCSSSPYWGSQTFCAYQSYLGRTGHQKVVGTVLGAIGLFVLGLIAEGRGYTVLAGVASAGLLAIGVYVLSYRRS